MIKFSRKVLSELEEELQNITFDYDNPLIMCEKSIEATEKHLKVLKSFVLTNEFESLENEILFFKTLKPKFTSKLIYYKKVRRLESRKPHGGKKIIREYLENELNKLNIYFSDNLEFYNYYRVGSNFIDNKIFIRNNVEINYNLESFYYELDHRFATTHDFKVAAILANELFQEYIENKISNLTGNKMRVSKIDFDPKTLRWTLSKTDLTELTYALHAQKAFNNGKVEIAEIVKCFEKTFDIDLGDFYRTSNGIKNRKKTKTKFINALSENLNKRYDEGDYK